MQQALADQLLQQYLEVTVRPTGTDPTGCAGTAAGPTVAVAVTRAGARAGAEVDEVARRVHVLTVLARLQLLVGRGVANRHRREKPEYGSFRWNQGSHQ